ncbi:anthrax toxin lethal factor-related metalloendopeptidase [Metabacillus niabensis]|uniref:anthrax toxin lethal factor-related metalloendopeptidase n=1 Tax=Metabacillus niabensis TaxID=324854 RepID=UPI001CFA5766|nr:toxin [Metabacillus niabensis]
MKKAGIVLFIILICIPFYHLARAFPEGRPLSTYQFETADFNLSKSVVNELILLPSSDFSEKEAIKMIYNIQKVDENILLLAVEESIQVQLFTGPLTNQNGLNDLKNIKPRGYGETDPNWDSVPGMSDNRVVYAKIGHSEFGKGHGSINLELHEFAHAIDRYVFHYVRFDPVFINIWKQEVDQLFPLKNYFLQFPEEYFAETFAMYYFDDKNKKALYEKAPLTFKYIQSLEEKAVFQQNNLYVNSQY